MGKKTQALDRGRLGGKSVMDRQIKFEVFGLHRGTFVRCRTSEKMLEDTIYQAWWR